MRGAATEDQRVPRRWVQRVMKKKLTEDYPEAFERPNVLMPD